MSTKETAKSKRTKTHLTERAVRSIAPFVEVGNEGHELLEVNFTVNNSQDKKSTTSTAYLSSVFHDTEEFTAIEWAITKGEEATNAIIDGVTKSQNHIAAKLFRENPKLNTVELSTKLAGNTIEITHHRDGELTSVYEMAASDEADKIVGDWGKMVADNFSDDLEDTYVYMEDEEDEVE